MNIMILFCERQSRQWEGKPLGKIFTKVICDKDYYINIQKKKNPLKTQQYDNEQPVLKISKRLKHLTKEDKQMVNKHTKNA